MTATTIEHPDGAGVPEGHGLLSALDRSGDTRVTWDPAAEAEVASARRAFDDLKAQGYAAYRTDGDGNRGEVIRSFDPAAARIVMVKPLVGG